MREPRATTYSHQISKVMSRRCLKESMQRCSSLGGEGHWIITTVDPTSNRKVFSLRGENGGRMPVCFWGFLEEFKKSKQDPKLQNLSLPLKTHRKYLLFSNSNLLSPVSTSFCPFCYAELHMAGLEEKATFDIIQNLHLISTASEQTLWQECPGPEFLNKKMF